MEIVNIQYNSKVLEKLQEHELHSDYLGSAFFILIALFEGKIELLNKFDDSSKNRRALILYRTLVRKELLKVAEDKSEILYNLTDKGVELVKWLKNEFDDVIAEDFAVEPVLTKVDPVEAWAEEYVNIFPKANRVHPKVIPERFEKFFKHFPEYNDKELILNATKLYIKCASEKENGLEYVRMANFFIWKMDGGLIFDLATWCSRYLQDKNNKRESLDTSILNLI